MAATSRHLAAPCRYCGGIVWRSMYGYHDCTGCGSSVTCHAAVTGRCEVCESARPVGACDGLPPC